MKNQPRELIYGSVERLGLPGEVFGASMLEITGGRELLISGNKGIRCFGESRIVIDLSDYALEIQGNGLHIVTMSGQELLIRGNLRQLVFLR